MQQLSVHRHACLHETEHERVVVTKDGRYRAEFKWMLLEIWRDYGRYDNPVRELFDAGWKLTDLDWRTMVMCMCPKCRRKRRVTENPIVS